MLIVFDWDGTLADSRQHIVAAMQRAIDELRLPRQSEEACASMIGLGLREAALTLYADLDDRGAELFCETYSRHFLGMKEEYPLELFAGVNETLDALSRRGLELAVATGKSRRGLERALGETGLREAFAVTRTADETASKPHPLMLQEILQATGRAREQAVMVGDTSYDLEMAQRAGVVGIGVSYGVHEPERLAQYQPVAMLHSIVELLDWLDSGSQDSGREATLV